MNKAAGKRDITISDSFDRKDLNELINTETSPCASAYMPMQRRGNEIRQNPIRFKNALSEIKAMSENQTEQDLDFEGLASLIEDEAFWQSQKEGMALYLSPDISRIYRLPLKFESLTTMTSRFHVTPVLPLIVYDATFFILALSQNECRLYQCRRQDCREVRPEKMPDSLEDSMKFDHQQKQIQFHTGAQPTQGGGERAAMFHGHGVADDADKDRILRYCQDVNKAVTEFLGSRTDPLIVAGVDFLHPLYRAANTHPHLLEKGITGNPEPLTGEELQAKAWEIVAPLTRAGLEQAVKRYHDLKGTGKAGNDLRRIVQDAPAGRIDQLIIPLDIHCWGRCARETGEVFVHDEKKTGDEDLLNLAAVHAMKNGASVFPLARSAMPDDSNIIALFRY